MLRASFSKMSPATPAHLCQKGVGVGAADARSALSASSGVGFGGGEIGAITPSTASRREPS